MVRVMTDDKWPMEADFTDITPMTKEERQRSKEREKQNSWRKCVSCGNQSKDTFCGFCLEEE
tara:strand:- start:1566 stop:1751 length:186 start_codon:yes stop_codon:yes gene_type:complete